MNADEIVSDLWFDLPRFEKIYQRVLVKNYVRAHHVALVGLVLSVLLKVI